MRKITIILSFFLVFNDCLQAQYNLKENNVWAFGFGAGLDFNGVSPVAIKTRMYSTEGIACLSNSSGSLLFYCGSDTIYDRNHNPMPNGYKLMSAAEDTTFLCNSQMDKMQVSMESATQGAIIVPVLDNPNQYYVFFLQELCFNGDPMAGRLFYSIVDMTLNNGMGDVILTKKGIQIDSGLSEKMIAIPGDNCNIWLLLHSNTGNTFKAYEITTTGINLNPKTSTTGDFSGMFSYMSGTIKISQNRRKLAVCSYLLFGTSIGVELCDFDPATGIVSNAVALNTSHNSYGACFSPDNSKLYIQGLFLDPETGQTEKLFQYDLSLPSQDAIINSEVLLAEKIVATDLKLANNNKIYMVSGTNRDSIGCINNPNIVGISCDYKPNVHALYPGTSGFMGLPNEYVKPLTDSIYSKVDTILSSTGELKITLPTGYFFYEWNDGSTDTQKILNSAGSYWVKYGNYCTYRIDTFSVTSPTGISGFNTEVQIGITAYPNPAKNAATVNINGVNKVDGVIRITDAIGRLVMEQKCSSKQEIINTGVLSPGIFTIEYKGKNGLSSAHIKLLVIK